MKNWRGSDDAPRLFLYLPGPWTILVAACMIFFSCSGGSDAGGKSPALHQGDSLWTYMVYLAADNDISDAARTDIDEMETVGSSSEMNIVVQAEFRSGGSAGHPASTIRGRVMHDSLSGSIGGWYEEIGNRDMTDPVTLTEFITWAAENYPAERYALVLWSHGSGWKDYPVSPTTPKGMFIDYTSAGRYAMMPLADLTQAVRDSNLVFDVINFDTCLMGMFEVAYEFRGTADYLVFSEGLYPTYGDSYDTILRELAGSPSMDGSRLARTTAARCREFYDQIGISGLVMTKSALDLSGIDRLHSELCRLAAFLCDHMDTERDHIEDARDASVSFEYPENHDLGSFLHELGLLTSEPDVRLLSGELGETISRMVIGNEIHGMDRSDEITGMSIYFPDRYEATETDLIQYAGLACNLSAGITWGSLLNLIILGETVPGKGE